MRSHLAAVALLVATTATAGCLPGTILGLVRGWLSSRDTVCDDYCALDCDPACGGDSVALARCMDACTTTDSAEPCVPARRALEACESRMTCEDFRSRREPDGQCHDERDALLACRSGAE